MVRMKTRHSDACAHDHVQTEQRVLTRHLVVVAHGPAPKCLVQRRGANGQVHIVWFELLLKPFDDAQRARPRIAFAAETVAFRVTTRVAAGTVARMVFHKQVNRCWLFGANVLPQVLALDHKLFRVFAAAVCVAREKIAIGHRHERHRMRATDVAILARNTPVAID